MSTKSGVVQNRGQFRYFKDIPTRWLDNDVYGHINNVVYYSFFDTIINCYLIDEAGLDIQNGSIIGVAVETMCRFHRSFAYPELVQAGLAVTHLGKTSVRYEVGLFGNEDDEARAQGHFVHVFIDRKSHRPQSIPSAIRAALEHIQR